MKDIRAEVAVAKVATVSLATSSTSVKNEALKRMAQALDTGRKRILEANDIDIKESEGLEGPLLKRLKVTDSKINGMIDGILSVISLEDPVGKTISTKELDDSLILYQISCPIGMLGVIFESRPDVVPQIMSLCLKSGNGVVFKGGREALNTNKCLFNILKEAISSVMNADAFVMAETRDDVNSLLDMNESIDLLIPRGSNEFVRYIQENTKIPVLGHAAGICHVYIDEYADIDKALSVSLDSKIQYPAVCNAAETILVHKDIASKYLPKMNDLLNEAGVEIRCDLESSKYMNSSIPADDKDWDTEYNDLIVSIKIINSIDDAICFINMHGSHHTDCIITENKESMIKFITSIDSAGVFVNASTRFADGYRYGKGAEVGISTNKIHSRGPVGMEGLMIYKYVLIGDGHIVSEYVGENAKKYSHKDLNKKLEL